MSQLISKKANAFSSTTAQTQDEQRNRGVTHHTSANAFIGVNALGNGSKVRDIDILSMDAIQSSFAPLYRNANLKSFINPFAFRNTYDSEDLYDTPCKTFFKLFFYFDDESNGELGCEGNLLGGVSYVTKDDEQAYGATDNTFNNSALEFLLRNGEYERAEYLNTFLTILSDINVKSPWYFQEISELQGLDAYKDGAWKMEANPYNIEITMLDDSIDHRVGMMLDAYRSACFSNQLKKEIIPANLRKFTLGIYVANLPLRGKHEGTSLGTTGRSPSYKYYELRGCEIAPETHRNTESLSNAELKNVKYKIKINYNSIYERRFNEFNGQFVGDDVFGDYSIVNEADENTLTYINVKNDFDDVQQRLGKYNATPKTKELDRPNARMKDQYHAIDVDARFFQHQNDTYSNVAGTLPQWPGEPRPRPQGLLTNFVTNATSQAVAYGVNKVETMLKKLYLGNLHTVSASRAIDQFGNALNGDVFGTVNAVKEYKRKFNGKDVHFDDMQLKVSGKSTTVDSLGDMRASTMPTQRDIMSDDLYQPIDLHDDAPTGRLWSQEDLQQKQNNIAQKNLRNNL